MTTPGFGPVIKTASDQGTVQETLAAVRMVTVQDTGHAQEFAIAALAPLVLSCTHAQVPGASPELTDTYTIQGQITLLYCAECFLTLSSETLNKAQNLLTNAISRSQSAL